MRFFIGFKKNAEMAAQAFAEMLHWREKHDVNEIRKRIMDGLQPHQFPRYTVVRRFYPLLKTGSGAARCWAAVCCCVVPLPRPAASCSCSTLLHSSRHAPSYS